MNHELPLGSITSPAGICASSIAATDVITFDGHGLETDDPVNVRVTQGGVLPAPLAEGTTYYAIRSTNATFKLAAIAGGAAINLTTDGISVVVTREPRYDDIIERFSRWADAFLPAHLVPLQQPIHPTVRGVVAELTAKKILNINGQDSAILTAAELVSKAMLERFATGLPLRGAPATGSANKAITSSLNVDHADPRGWGSATIP